MGWGEEKTPCYAIDDHDARTLQLLRLAGQMNHSCPLIETEKGERCRCRC